VYIFADLTHVRAIHALALALFAPLRDVAVAPAEIIQLAAVERVDVAVEADAFAEEETRLAAGRAVSLLDDAAVAPARRLTVARAVVREALAEIAGGLEAAPGVACPAAALSTRTVAAHQQIVLAVADRPSLVVALTFGGDDP